jgi:hypothetical protein
MAGSDAVAACQPQPNCIRHSDLTGAGCFSPAPTVAAPGANRRRLVRLPWLQWAWGPSRPRYPEALLYHTWLQLPPIPAYTTYPCVSHACSPIRKIGLGLALEDHAHCSCQIAARQAPCQLDCPEVPCSTHFHLLPTLRL